MTQEHRGFGEAFDPEKAPEDYPHLPRKELGPLNTLFGGQWIQRLNEDFARLSPEERQAHLLRIYREKALQQNWAIRRARDIARREVASVRKLGEEMGLEEMGR